MRRRRIILPLLFVGAFVMGTAEMLVVGMLDLIVVDLEISVSAAGALVTANALGLAIGGPLLTLLTTRLDRRVVLLGALATFTILNVLPALGAPYLPFVLARVVIGAAQGLYIAAALTTATSIVPADRTGRAMAVVISGFATSSALGLPLGTLLGQAIGWRGSFIAVVAISVVVLATATVVLPRVPTPEGSRAAGQAKFAFAPRVLAVLAVAGVMFIGIQSALTYVVPYLAEVTGITGPLLSAYLLAYGVATTVGSALGGPFADRNAARALIVGTCGVALSLIALRMFGANPVLAAASIVGMGLFGMGIAPSIQHRVVSLAGPGAPLASSLPASAVNAGIALGSLTGGVAIGVGGVPLAVVAGAAAAIAAIAAASATSFIPLPITPHPREEASL